MKDKYASKMLIFILIGNLCFVNNSAYEAPRNIILDIFKTSKDWAVQKIIELNS